MQNIIEGSSFYMLKFQDNLGNCSRICGYLLQSLCVTGTCCLQLVYRSLCILEPSFWCEQTWNVGGEERDVRKFLLLVFLLLSLFFLKMSALVLDYGECCHQEECNFSLVKSHMFATILHIHNILYQKGGLKGLGELLRVKNSPF